MLLIRLHAHLAALSSAALAGSIDGAFTGYRHEQDTLLNSASRAQWSDIDVQDSPCRMSEAFADPAAAFAWSTPASTDLMRGAPLRGNELTLHVRGCNLTRRVDDRIDAVRSCFSRLGHVVLAGDSVTRNSYISLVHFVHTGTWLPRDGPPSDVLNEWQAMPPARSTDDVDSTRPIEVDFKRYFRGISSRLGGYEICDCYVGDDGHVENHYYSRDGVRLSYGQLFSSRFRYVMHSPTWLNVSCDAPPCVQRGCSPGYCQPELGTRHLLSIAYPTSYFAVANLMRPDVLVFNTGLHEPGVLETARGVELVLGVAREASRRRTKTGNLHAAWNEMDHQAERDVENTSAADSSSKVHFVWRTTTPFRNEDVVVVAATALPKPLMLGVDATAPRAPWPRREQNITEAVTRTGGRVFDAFSIVWPLAVQLAAIGSVRGTSWPTDRHHHAPAVNAGVNRALIAFLCEDDEDWA